MRTLLRPKKGGKTKMTLNHNLSLAPLVHCKARKRLPLELIRRLALKVGETLEHEIPVDWKWRGRSVKLMDGTTISMPDTASNQSVYPQSGVQQAGLGFPLAMLVAVISLSTGAVLEWVLGPCRGKHTGEQALFRELWQDRVRRILVEHADDPELVSIVPRH